MENDAAFEASVTRVSLFGRQHCPTCSYQLIAPDESHHLSDHLIRHVWSCEECGTGFATWVKLRHAVPVMPHAVAA
jgi:hypothetical protein